MATAACTQQCTGALIICIFPQCSTSCLNMCPPVEGPDNRSGADCLRLVLLNVLYGHLMKLPRLATVFQVLYYQVANRRSGQDIGKSLQ